MATRLYYGRTLIGTVPDRWGKAKIDDDLVEIQGGFACAKKYAVSSGLPHLRPFNITTSGEVIITDDTVQIPPDFKDGVEFYYLQENDVLFNNTNSVELVGKTGIVRKPMSMAFSNHINRLRVRDANALDPRWLALALQNLQRQGFFALHCRKWIGQAGFSASALSNVEIPLPDIDTQQKIVTQIEALSTEVQELQQLNLDIKNDTERMLEAVLVDLFKDLKNEYPQASLQDSDLCQVIPGQHIMSRDYSNSPPGTPYITGPADFGTKFPVITRWTNQPKVIAQPGDVLFTVKGSGVGKVNCSLPEAEVAIGRQIMALRPNSQALNTDYLFFHLLGRFREFQTWRQGAAIPGIRREHVYSIKFPLPSMDVQERIVDHIVSLQNELEEMLKINGEDERLLEVMQNAVLAKAFQGDL